jgi:hypothetical protein
MREENAARTSRQDHHHAHEDAPNTIRLSAVARSKSKHARPWQWSVLYRTDHDWEFIPQRHESFHATAAANHVPSTAGAERAPSGGRLWRRLCELALAVVREFIHIEITLYAALHLVALSTSAQILDLPCRRLSSQVSSQCEGGDKREPYQSFIVRLWSDTAFSRPGIHSALVRISFR